MVNSLLLLMTMPPSDRSDSVKTSCAGGTCVPPVALTPMQYRFMVVLQSHLARNPDKSPSFEELRLELGLGSKSGVARLVQACIDRGRIAKLPEKARTLTVIAPVHLDEAMSCDLIKSFSDKELIHEVQERGLITVSQFPEIAKP